VVRQHVEHDRAARVRIVGLPQDLPLSHHACHAALGPAHDTDKAFGNMGMHQASGIYVGVMSILRVNMQRWHMRSHRFQNKERQHLT